MREGGTQRVNSRQKGKEKPHPQDIPRVSTPGRFTGEVAGCFLTGEGDFSPLSSSWESSRFLHEGGPILFGGLVHSIHEPRSQPIITLFCGGIGAGQEVLRHVLDLHQVVVTHPLLLGSRGARERGRDKF